MRIWIASLLCALAACAATGPEQGKLLIAGGGSLDKNIWQKFVDLAGGPDAPVIYIPTAGDVEPTATSGDFLKKAGFRHVTTLHTRDRKLADTDAFIAPILAAKAVWFGGGRQWRIVEAYGGTKTEAALAQVLARGGVIGGTSAGATIQGSYLVRGARSGNDIMMAPEFERGFAYLKESAIDQHLIKRGREKDLWQVIRKHPALLGIGIDESTAIVVEGNRFEVIGVSKVAIYDAKQTTHYFLNPGERFDMKQRQKLPASSRQ